MSIPADFQIDRALVRHRAQRAAPHASSVEFLAREISQRMLPRLDVIKLAPAHILDLGCGLAHDFAALKERYPQAKYTGVDFAHNMLLHAQNERGRLSRKIDALLRKNTPQLLCADAENLPLPHASVEMIWSNLMLNWLHDPLPALREMHRVLTVEGMVMFATLGPDTLRELRSVLPTQHGERVHRFIDMHDLGDALMQAGFSEPVMDMDTLTLTYNDLDSLMRELRQAGATNASTARPVGLSGKAAWAKAREAYEPFRQEGRLPVTVEIVYGHAWKAAPKTIADGRAVIQVQRKPKADS